MKNIFKLIAHYTLTVILLVILVRFAIAYRQGISTSRITDEEKEIKELSLKKDELTARLNYVKSDEYIGKVARNNLMYTKDNEKFLIIEKKEETIKEPNTTSTAETNTKDLKEKEIAYWKLWAKSFKLSDFMVNY